jgi:hypothetical protein
VTPSHLGGHCGVTHTDRAVLDWVLSEHQGTTLFVDIGCGPGEVVVQAQSFPHVTPIGIDGDPSLKEVWQSHYPVSPEFFCHDFAEGPTLVPIEFFATGPVAERVVVWSVEFVEHVEERYIPNYLPVFADADVVVMTHSEDPRGHHHVNCQPESYWRGVMAAAGLRLDEESTAHIRAISTMTREFMRNTGQVYRKGSSDA